MKYKIADVGKEDAYHDLKDVIVGKLGNATAIIAHKNSDYCRCEFEFDNEITFEDDGKSFTEKKTFFFEVKLEQIEE